MITTNTGQEVTNLDAHLNQVGIFKRYNHFMIDLETTGVKPDLNQVVEIAVVPFEMVGLALDVAPVELHLKFKLNDQQLHRQADIHTLKWWAKQNKQVQEEVFSDFQNYSFNNKNVLLGLAKFIAKLTSGNTNFWAKPTLFDFMFLQSLFNDFNVPFPFKHQKAKDLNSYLSGLSWALYRDLDIDRFKPEKIEGAHNSLLDCYYQLNWLVNGLKHVQKQSESFELDDDLPF